MTQRGSKGISNVVSAPSELISEDAITTVFGANSVLELTIT
jgi:hypothetical protein